MVGEEQIMTDLMKTVRAVFAPTFAAALLAACGSPGMAISPDAVERAVAAGVAAPTASEWPDPSSAVWKQGTFPNLEDVRKMGAGMGKDQVRALLGSPHFREGLWGESEWNYLFQMRTGSAGRYVTCQYMVRYNDTPLSTGAWWKTGECASLASVK